MLIAAAAYDDCLTISLYITTYCCFLLVSIVKPYMNMALFVSSIQLSSRLLINMYKHLLVNTIKFTLIYVLASRSAGVVVTASVISSGRCDEGQYSNSISGLSDCTIYQWCINGKAVYQ